MAKELAAAVAAAAAAATTANALLSMSVFVYSFLLLLLYLFQFFSCLLGFVVAFFVCVCVLPIRFVRLLWYRRMLV